MARIPLKINDGRLINMQIASILPSILWMDFLEQQNLSLHVFANEKIAYFESE